MTGEPLDSKVLVVNPNPDPNDPNRNPNLNPNQVLVVNRALRKVICAWQEER